jgi:hypothetical protein
MDLMVAPKYMDGYDEYNKKDAYVRTETENETEVNEPSIQG